MSRALYNEIDPHAAQWLRNLISRGVIAPGDVNESSIVDLRPSDLDGYDQVHFFAGIGVWSYAARLAGWPDDRPLWTASCPCQPFSAAGKGAGFADERHLWPALDWLIDQRRPEAVVGEQVASADGLAWIDLVQADVEGKSYAFGSLDSCAAGFGAPNIRQRQYWMALSGVALGDADGARLEGWRLRPRQRSGERPAWPPGAIGGMADGAGGRRDALVCGDATSQESAQREYRMDVDRRSIVGGMGDAAGNRQRELRQPAPRSRQEIAPRGSGFYVGLDGAGRAGPVNGFWQDADWLFCTDGKWRPVEPGTFPLVDGAAFRLGSGSPFAGRSRAKMLKGYGNAINAEQRRRVYLCRKRVRAFGRRPAWAQGRAK